MMLGLHFRIFTGLICLLGCCWVAAVEPVCAPLWKESELGEVAPVPFDRIRLSPQSWVGRIVINDRRSGICESTWLYVRAALETFRRERPAYVILELNTPGGEIFSAQRIANAIRALDTVDGIPVVAYINNWAVSAGAMLAYSCRYIVAAPDAIMGAAEPVFQTQGGMEPAPEKIHSAMRSEFANRAALFGRNPDIARAMVDADTILVRRHGTILSLGSEAEIVPGGDEVISAKGKLLTLTAEQMGAFGVADVVLSKEHAGSPEDPIPEEMMISATPLGECRGLAAYDVPIRTFQMDMKTSLMAALVSPALSSVLAGIVFVCLYLEVSSPGLLIPGIVGGVALLLLVMGSFAQEVITWFEPLCIAVGVLLVSLELVFFPTMGVLAVVGGGLALVGLVMLVVPGLSSVRIEGEALNAAGDYVVHRLTWLSGAFLSAIAVSIMISRAASSRRSLFSHLVLGESKGELTAPLDIAVGDEAVVVATLRPAGKIEFGHRWYDAVSDGAFIECHEKVRVLAIRGNTVVVTGLGSV